MKDALIRAHGTIIVSHASFFMRKGDLGGSISAELTGALHDYAGPHKDINSFPARLFQGLGDMIAN